MPSNEPGRAFEDMKEPGAGYKDPTGGPSGPNPEPSPAQTKTENPLLGAVRGIADTLVLSPIVGKAVAAVRTGSTQELDADLLHLLQSSRDHFDRLMAVVALLDRRSDAVYRQYAVLQRMRQDEGEPMEPTQPQAAPTAGGEPWMADY